MAPIFYCLRFACENETFAGQSLNKFSQRRSVQRHLCFRKKTFSSSETHQTNFLKLCKTLHLITLIAELVLALPVQVVKDTQAGKVLETVVASY